MTPPNQPETRSGAPVGWGIIGCGDVVERKSGPVFKQVPGSRLVTVMRRTEAAVRDFAERHQVPEWTTDAQAVIDHPDVTAVYIATPPEHHLEYALAVARAGKACLVEKPAGRSAAECRQMVEAFEAAGAPLWISYYRRDLPRYRAVKEIIDSGQLGALVSVEYRMSKQARFKQDRWNRATNGGGRFYDLAGHMFDLFDDWFGPIKLNGAAVANVIPGNTTEDAVALSFTAAGDVVGSAAWNFSAPASVDELVIQGLRGRIRMRGTSVDGAVHVELSPEAAIRLASSMPARAWQQARQKLKLTPRQTHRFGKVELPHRRLVENIVGQLATGHAVGNGREALRTSQFLDAALAEYYGGRDDQFWNRPASWRTRRAAAADRTDTAISEAYQLTPAELKRFDEDGYIGPFRCDANWQNIIVPIKKGRNLHLREPAVFDVCAHPSIVHRVAQAMRQPHLSLFKSRFVVKLPDTPGEVAWHQDAGENNGGFTADGLPVPTVTVWMAFDEVSEANGAMKIIPRSHLDLVGDFKKRIRAELIEKGVLTQEDLARAVTFALRPGEFYIFHSWLLHGSGPNTSKIRRAGLNSRYSPQGYDCEPEVEYIPLRVSAVAESNELLRDIA